MQLLYTAENRFTYRRRWSSLLITSERSHHIVSRLRQLAIPEWSGALNIWLSLQVWQFAMPPLGRPETLWLKTPWTFPLFFIRPAFNLSAFPILSRPAAETVKAYHYLALLPFIWLSGKKRFPLSTYAPIWKAIIKVIILLAISLLRASRFPDKSWHVAFSCSDRQTEGPPW